MRCSFRSALILRIMRLGITLHEPECIVAAIMGFAFLLPGNENLPGERIPARSDISDIHPIMTGSQRSRCSTTAVDTLNGYPAF